MTYHGKYDIHNVCYRLRRRAISVLKFVSEHPEAQKKYGFHDFRWS